IDATLGQQLFVTMQDGLRIEGTVRDGERSPVTAYAFKAVWLRGVPPPGQPNLDLNAVMAQLRDGTIDAATRTQLMQQAESLRGQFDRGNGGRRGPDMANANANENGRGGGPGGGGPGGQARDLGKPENHPGGTFVATGLQEGVYEVHVQSPDHARYRSAEVELRTGMAAPSLDIVLDGGVFVAGVVLDANGQGVRGARVEMRTPSAFEGLGRRGRGQNGQNGGAAPAAPAAPGGNQDWGGMAREFMRMANGTQVSLEATTNADGEFVIKHAPRGNYRLSAEARGHADAQTEPFDLQRDRSDFELRLGALGTITGTISGVRAEELAEVRVGAMPWSNGGANPRAMMGGRGGRGGGGGGQGPFATTNVRADGTYVFDNLTPGDYLVRAWIGSPQDIMRELMPRLGDGTLQADATVRAGETTKLDLQVVRPQIGTVTGSVLLNGKAASGFQVELARENDGAQAGTSGNGNGGGGGGGRGGRGFGPGGFGNFGRTFQSAVSASGRFTIGNVTAGTYKLRVQNNRRGGTLHEELVQVVADATIDRAINLVMHSLTGAVTRDDGGNVAELNGRVTLIPGVTAVPDNMQTFAQRDQLLEGRVQAGKFTFENVAAGNYLLVVNIRGRDRATLPIVVVGDQSVTLAAGKPAEPGTAPANSPTPRANPRQNR
ncbi:MAG: carboxypeptidase regulatory-like domain-containing protein, partial [Planctomycetes bacterium]|nr:carboxypeptidase regulatory-like domain-containing protein [Planctomycetota bacterium]